MSEPLSVLAAGWPDLSRDAALAPLGAGHINDTFHVTSGSRQFVLQRVSRQVFADPGRLMSNLERVLAHVSARAPGFVPELVPSVSGRAAHVDGEESWWRVWRHVAGVSGRDQLDARAAHAAGAAFGRFERLMADFPEPALEPSIDGFLELPHYLDALEAAAAAEPALAAGCVDRALLEQHAHLAQLFPAGDRYVHGDCKIDNLVFDARGQVCCVLDLDTVRRGHWAWDFGDLVRSLGTASGSIDADVYGAAARGFLDAAGIDAAAGDLLAAPRYVAFMLGVRFLTDHLLGDGYFKVARRGENLDRARRQFAIVAELQARAPALQASLDRAQVP